MRTLFLLGILGALVVIATKKNDQTAMEAAVEMGKKAQNYVTELEGAKTANKASEILKDLDKKDSFIRRTKEVLAKTKEKGHLRTGGAASDKKTKSDSKTIEVKPIVKSQPTPEKPDWKMPKPPEMALPDIPAMPKASVETVSLGTGSPLQLANAERAPVDVGRSYDLVKGYYENASRLLEEIK
jgi:hypothetical protein